jgi:hypothetical protein
MLAGEHTPDQILQALRFGVDYKFTIRVRSLEVAVRPLSITERVEVVNDVTADLLAKPESQRNSLTESSLVAIRTIERATTPSPDSKVAPLLPAKLLGQLTNEELLALYKAYVDGCDKLDPAMETLTRDQLDVLVDAAKKNPTQLTEWPRPHLEKLARYLLTASESQEGNTSGG